MARLNENEHHQNTVIQVLKKHGELGFREIFKEAQNTKWPIGSMETLSKTLRTLKIEGKIEQNPITRKYRLTESGKIHAGKQALAEEVLSSRYFDIYSSDWRSEFCYILIGGKENCSENAMLVAHKRLEEQGISWENSVVKALEILHSDYKSLKEDWSKLFQGVETIMLVHVFKPWQFFERLQTQTESKRVLSHE